MPGSSTKQSYSAKHTCKLNALNQLPCTSINILLQFTLEANVHKLLRDTSFHAFNNSDYYKSFSAQNALLFLVQKKLTSNYIIQKKQHSDKEFTKKLSYNCEFRCNVLYLNYRGAGNNHVHPSVSCWCTSHTLI